MGNNNKTNLDALRINPDMKNTESPKKKWLIITAVIAVFVVIAGFFFFRNAPLETTLITITASESNQNAAVLTASGYVEPRRKATIASKITGQIKELLVEEGMKVKEDQVLARLDDSEALARYESGLAEEKVAKAGLNELQVNLDNSIKLLNRRKELFQKGWVSREQLDNAETTVDSYKARIKLAQEQMESAATRTQIAKRDLDNCTIRAPFPGIAVSKDAQVGEMVSPISAGGGYTRTGISTIVDMNSLEIEVDVNESYIAKVKVNQKVTAVLDSYQEWKIPAHVRTIIPTADRQKATVKVRIAFDKLDPKILPDMGIKVYFLSEKTAENKGPVIILPDNALFENNDKSYVFLVKSGKVEKRAVLTGEEFNSGVSILAGLVAGDQVVADGALPLKEGQAVIAAQ
ncbi:MAG: efflux RND transporter periplasmic adaptor subunit [bacterium]|nr:efflux RND transporter periplasmic adaptor subunit [bacterium]